MAAQLKVPRAWHPVYGRWVADFSASSSAPARRIAHSQPTAVTCNGLLPHAVEQVTQSSGVGLRNCQTPAGFAEVLSQQQALYDACPL